MEGYIRGYMEGYTEGVHGGGTQMGCGSCTAEVEFEFPT